MAKVNIKPQYQNIVKMFVSLTGSKRLWQVYQDCIEMIAMSIQNSVEIYPERFERHEKIYQSIQANYSEAESEIIAKIFAEIVQILEKNPFQDLLGDLYMQLNMGNNALGQFFTPYSISQLMAEFVYNESIFKEAIDKNGVVKISEPCIGGGANIIALLEVMQNKGINYQKNVIVIGQDISRTTALMAYIVLSLLGSQAVIKIANTFTDPYTNFYNEIKNENVILYTPMFVVYNGFTKEV